MLGVPQGDTDLPDLQEGRGCWYQQQKLAHNSFNLKCHELHVYILVGTLFATLAVKTNNAPPCPPPPGQAGTGQISRPEDGDTDCDGYKITSTLLAEPITLDMEKTLSSRQLELVLHVLTTGKSHLGRAAPPAGEKASAWMLETDAPMTNWAVTTLPLWHGSFALEALASTKNAISSLLEETLTMNVLLKAFLDSWVSCPVPQWDGFRILPRCHSLSGLSLPSTAERNHLFLLSATCFSTQISPCLMFPADPWYSGLKHAWNSITLPNT